MTLPFVSLFGPFEDKKRKAVAPPPSPASLLESPSAENSRKRLFWSIDAAITENLDKEPDALEFTPTRRSLNPHTTSTTLPLTPKSSTPKSPTSGYPTSDPPTPTSSVAELTTAFVLCTPPKPTVFAPIATSLSTTVNGMQIFDREIEDVVENRLKEVLTILEPALLTYLKKTGIEFRPLTIQPMVLGNTEDDARPWIVISCQKLAKHKVKGFLKKDVTKNICRGSRPDQPKFDTAVIGRPLQTKTSETLYEVLVEGPNSDTPNLWIPKIKVIHSDSPHYATLGGFVCIVDSYGKKSTYGITAGHVLPADRLYSQDVPFDGDDSDLDGASEASNDTNDDQSYNCSSNELSSDPGYSGEFSDSSVFDDTLFTGDSENPEDIWFVSLGNVSEVSHSRRARDRDWALVELTALHDGRVELPNTLENGQPQAAYPSNDRSAVVSNSSQQKCTISALPARAILSSGHNFVDVHILNLHGENAPPSGSSGSWVIASSQSSTTDVYGVFIATDSFGCLWMVPMMDILEDICAEFKAADVNLSSSVERKDVDYGSANGGQEWAKLDTPKSLEPSNNETIADPAEHSEAKLSSKLPRSSKSPEIPTDRQDHDFSSHQYTMPPNLSELGSIKVEGRREAVVWYCSDCGDGPTGNWQSQCAKCNHIRCHGCNTETFG